MRRLLIALAASAMASAAAAEPFSFVAFGDTAYRLPRDTARVERLIGTINADAPAFTIHVGDFKGYTSCDDAAYRAKVAEFGKLSGPLILTPGDNDWFDCTAETAGRFDPLERLGALRRMMFAGPSLGSTPLPLQRQPDLPENARWEREGVVFATVHAIGPHNGLVRDKRLAEESVARAAAGERWLREAFARARAAKAPALVLAFQADPWLPSAPGYENGPFDWLRNAIGEEAATFAGQVLVVHGDSHRLIIDTPYRRADIEAGTTRGMNVTRLMVPGWPDHRAMRVDVDTDRPGVFGYAVLMQQDESAGARP